RPVPGACEPARTPEKARDVREPGTYAPRREGRPERSGIAQGSGVCGRAPHVRQAAERTHGIGCVRDSAKAVYTAYKRARSRGRIAPNDGFDDADIDHAVCTASSKIRPRKPRDERSISGPATS